MQSNKKESLNFSQFEGKMPWNIRLKIINEAFPSIERLDWDRAFREDPTILGNIINDIIKHEQAISGKPGKRPALNIRDAEKSLLRYNDEDYSILNFKESFIVLKGERSIRHMANYCGLTNTMVQRIMEDRAEPTMEIMEKIAKSFKKNPSYFLEYRIMYVMSIIVERMQTIPESSIVPYKKLKKIRENKI